MKSLKNTINGLLRKNSVRSVVTGLALVSGGMMASAEDDAPKAQEQQTVTMDMNKILKKQRSADTICRSLTKSKLAKYEVYIDHFYFDSKGLLTTGTGLNVDSWESFNKLEITDLEGNLIKDEKQKKAAYQKIMAKKANYTGKFKATTADKYKDVFGCKATSGSMDTLKEERIKVAEDLAHYYCGFNFYNLHPYIQSEIVCYCYSLSPKVLDQYKKFFAALEKLDYETAAKESNVIGWGQTRKDDVLKEFQKVSKNFSMKLGDAMENAFLDEVLKDFPESSNTIRRGVWDGKQCVVVGPGIPVTLKDMQELHLPDYCGVKNADILYKEVFNQKQIKELPADVVRQCVKRHFNANRKTMYNSLCTSFNAQDLRVQASLLRVHIGTAGKGRSFGKMRACINKKDFEGAARECIVSERVFARSNPASDPEVLKANCQQFNARSVDILSSCSNPIDTFDRAVALARSNSINNY